MDPVTQEFLTRRISEIAEDALRARLIDESPQLQRELAIMAQVIRESVAWEREKRGLDKGGKLSIFNNKAKHYPNDPDFIGAGQIAGRPMELKGWKAQTADQEGFIKCEIKPKS